MNSKASTLTVQHPIPQKQLGRFRDKKGICLVRHADEVLYVGASENIYKAIMRLFQKGGVLSHLNRHKMQFEVIETRMRSPSVENVLKRYFLPKYNQRIKKLTNPTFYRKRKCKQILESYLAQSIFEPKGEHKQDLNQ